MWKEGAQVQRVSVVAGEEKGGICSEATKGTERVQKGVAHWDKQNNDMPASNCVLKVQGEIIKIEGL